MTPKFFSVEFHARFFPAIIRNRLRPEERERTAFSSTFEHYIVLAVCIILIFLGLPSAVNNNSFIGWIVGGAGAVGIIVLFIHSIVSGRGNPSEYGRFLTGVFFFFVTLGVSAGIFVGSLNHSLLTGLLLGSAGILSGYFLGILAGLWFQYLGWLSGVLNGVAWLAVFGMLLVDIVILVGTM
jgi:hypothetical protein